MSDITPELIASLKAAHGELTLLTSGQGVEVIARNVNELEWKRWRQQSADPATRVAAVEALFRSVVVHPPAVELEKLLKRYPALPEEFNNELGELAGLTGKATAKKL
jgi:hypothetical protein